MILRRVVLVLVVTALLAAAVVLAQGPVWHEYVPDVESSEGSAIVAGAGAEPSAIVHDGEILTAPEGGALRSNERAMRASPGDGRERGEEGRRSPSFRPDRVTALAGGVGYYEIFTPSIRPYKRVTALDAVTLDAVGTPILTIADPDVRTRVVIEGANAPAPDLRARDRFWGTVVLDFTEGREVPLPSVAAEARILTLRTEPATALHVERDGADNFYVVLEGSAPAVSSVRVVFLTDAPRSYFGLEEGMTLPAAPADTTGFVRGLPASVSRDAMAFASDLGLSPGQPFDETIDRLTEHFRSFEESVEPPGNTGNIFLDLARGMRGVCRHRAYAFVITALALGIPARFVENEAHAWAEVRLPEHRGWIRVDLGGSAAGLTEHRADADAAEYHPDVDDPFPHPEPYRRALEAAARASLAAAEARASEALDEGPGAGGASADWQPTDEPPAHVPPAAAPPGPAVVRRPLALHVDGDGTFEVMRGDTLSVTGTADSNGAPAGGVRIDFYLVDDAHHRERHLGVTVTATNGTFQTSLGLPVDLRPDEYELVARSPGGPGPDGSTYLPATAR